MNVAATMQDLRSEAGRANPYPSYAALHLNGPVCPVEGEYYQYVVNGYDAVNQVLRDPSFLVSDGEMMERNGLRWREHPCLNALMTSMFFANPPEHTRLRGMYSRVVTPRRIQRLRAPIVAIVDRLLDQMAQAGAGGATMDFMTKFGFPMPGDVICELIGVPDENRAWFVPRAHIFADILDLGVSSPDVLEAGDAATVELTRYFGELLRMRQADPRDDMISSFAAMQQTDARVDEAELLAGLLTFFNAGFASTSYLLGSGIPQLVGQPEQIAAIQADEAAAADFVEEILRFEPPVHLAARVASEDREVAGVMIPAESRILVLLGAANHDPTRFLAPEVFDPHRADNRPMTFGAGVHFCLGAGLTRLEGQIALPMIFKRFPELALAGEPTRTHRLTLSGYQSLPITIA